MTPLDRLAFSLALLAYPRAFRRRFGAEMLPTSDLAPQRSALRHRQRTFGTFGTLR